MSGKYGTYGQQLEAVRRYRAAARCHILYLLEDPDHYKDICALQESRLKMGFEKFKDQAMFKWDDRRLTNELKQELADALNYGSLLFCKGDRTNG